MERVDGMCILFDFDFFVLEEKTYAFGITWNLVFTSTNQIIHPQNLEAIVINRSPVTLTKKFKSMRLT